MMLRSLSFFGVLVFSGFAFGTETVRINTCLKVQECKIISENEEACEILPTCKPTPFTLELQKDSDGLMSAMDSFMKKTTHHYVTVAFSITKDVLSEPALYTISATAIIGPHDWEGEGYLVEMGSVTSPAIPIVDFSAGNFTDQGIILKPMFTVKPEM